LSDHPILTFILSVITVEEGGVIAIDGTVQCNGQLVADGGTILVKGTLYSESNTASITVKNGGTLMVLSSGDIMLDKGSIKLSDRSSLFVYGLAGCGGDFSSSNSEIYVGRTGILLEGIITNSSFTADRLANGGLKKLLDKKLTKYSQIFDKAENAGSFTLDTGSSVRIDGVACCNSLNAKAKVKKAGYLDTGINSTITFKY